MVSFPQSMTLEEGARDSVTLRTHTSLYQRSLPVGAGHVCEGLGTISNRGGVSTSDEESAGEHNWAFSPLSQSKACRLVGPHGGFAGSSNLPDTSQNVSCS